jgi:hypothetical protein
MTFQDERTLKDRFLSLPVTMGYALAALVFIVTPRSMSDPDIWWHLRNAQILLQTHHFITQDTFSSTALHAAWMNHEWIAELPYYWGWYVAGGKGVWFVNAIAITMVTVGIYLVSYRRSKSAVGSFAVALAGMFLSSVSYGPRTLLFGWMCLIAEMYLLECIYDRDTPRPALAWLLPPLYIVWVNTHGSWLIGIALLGIFFLTSAFPFQWGAISSRGMDAKTRRTILGASIASIAALFVNPYGWKLVAYPFNLAFHQKLNVENVEEWKPTDVHTVRGEILLVLLAIAILWQIYKQREWELHDLAFVGAGLYSALSHSRFLYMFAITAAPAFAMRFPPVRRGENYRPKPLLNLLTMAVLTIMAVKQTLLVKDVDSQKAMPLFPVDALPTLQAMHLQGKVFNDFLWGGYMIWNLRDVPDFIDSRVDIFEYNGTFKDYLDIIRIKDTARLLDQQNVRYVLYEQDAPLAYFLEHTSGWKIDYLKGNVVLLERTAPLPR